MSAPLKPPSTPRPWRRRDLAGLLVVFAVALGLRWAWPGVVDFKLDEASASRLALAWAQRGEFPLYGVTSSTGIPTSPNAIWVLALPYFLGPDPLLATAWFALLSALSVAVGYWLAHRYFGAPAALVTGLLHAVSPWSVYHARKVWTPGAQPLFAVLTVATGVLGFIEGRKRWQAAHVFMLAFTVGVHFSSLPLALVSAFLALTNWRQVNWRMIGLGVLAVVAITMPFIVGIIQNPNIIMTENAAIQGHEVKASEEALKLTLQNTTGAELYRWADPDAQRESFADFPVDVPLLMAILLAAGIGGLVRLSWRHRREAVGKFGLAALVWLCSYTLMFTVQWAPIHPHYYIALWPAPYLAIGSAVAIVLAEGRATGFPRLRQLTIGVIGVLSIMVLTVVEGQIATLNRFYTFAGAHFTPGDFGTPLGMKMHGARAALDLLDATDATEIIVVGEGDRPYQHEGPGGFEVMLYNAPHRFVDGTRVAVLPDHPAVILLQPRAWPADPWYLAASEVRERIPLRADEGEYTLLLYDPARRAALLAGFTPAAPPDMLDNGVRVLGHRWADDGQIEIAWRVEHAPPTDEDFHFTVYFFDADAHTLIDPDRSKKDGPSHWTAYWQPGDVAVNWFPLAPPEGALLAAGGVQLRTVMYTYPDIERASAVDEAGNPVGDSVLLDDW